MTKTSSLPKTLKALLLSLAISDLGVGLIVQPLYIAVLVMRLESNFEENPAYKATYKAFLFPLNLLCFASFFGVTALTVDRFLAIHLHLRYQELVSHKRVTFAMISFWVLSAILSLIEVLLPAKDKNVVFAFIEVLCLITITVLYCKIYLAVRHHANQLQALQVQQNTQNGDTVNATRLRKSAVATFYVYLVFLVCYIPQSFIYVAIVVSGSRTTVIKGLQRYALPLILLNSSLNPLIYCLKMRNIRPAIIDILRTIFAKSQLRKKTGIM